VKITQEIRNRQQFAPAMCQRLLRQLKEKYFDYFVFNIVDYIYINCGLLRSGGSSPRTRANYRQRSGA
jgi:hypothetical protein